MGKFFCRLINENLINEWGEVIDWLFNDKRFDECGWNRAYLGEFSKKVKKIKPICDNLQCGSINNLKFPCKKRNKETAYVIFCDKNGFGRSFVKHIRNGIAHGTTSFTNTKQGLYIEIIDYKNENHDVQTAFIYFPINCIIKIHKVYKAVEKSINNNRPRGRKTEDKRLDYK